MNTKTTLRYFLLLLLLATSAFSYAQTDSNSNNKDINLDGIILDKASFNLVVKRRLSVFGDCVAMLATAGSKEKQESLIKNVGMPLFNNDTLPTVGFQNRGKEPVKRRIHRYFKRLMGLSYDNVEVTNSEIQYVTELFKGPDGNYHGTCVFLQTFNGTRREGPSYLDKTKKNIEIIVHVSSEEEQGVVKRKWSLYLGNIEVIELIK